MTTKTYPIYDKYVIKPNAPIIIMSIKRPGATQIGRLKVDVRK